MTYDFPITRNPNPKQKPDQDHLVFGQHFSDHMFVMDYDEGQGWHDGRIIPYGDISIDPASCVLHYAQMMFEGMKAYKTADGHVQLFQKKLFIRQLHLADGEVFGHARFLIERIQLIGCNADVRFKQRVFKDHRSR